MKTVINVENLEKLARYLLQPKIMASFDMQDFAEFKDDSKKSTVCGSVGCAVGHGPYAGIPKRNNQSWMMYSNENFIKCYVDGDEWDWCFSNYWVDYDNTPLGAALRILVLTRGDGVPKNFDNHFSEAHNGYLKYLVDNNYFFKEEWVKEFLDEVNHPIDAGEVDA